MRLKSFSRPSSQRTKMWAELNASIDDTDIQKSDRVSLIRLLWAAAAASERKKRPLMGLLGNHTKHTILYQNILYRTKLSILYCTKPYKAYQTVPNPPKSHKYMPQHAIHPAPTMPQHAIHAQQYQTIHTEHTAHQQGLWATHFLSHWRAPLQKKRPSRAALMEAKKTAHSVIWYVRDAVMSRPYNSCFYSLFVIFIFYLMCQGRRNEPKSEHFYLFEICYQRRCSSGHNSL